MSFVGVTGLRWHHQQSRTGPGGEVTAGRCTDRPPLRPGSAP